MDTALANRCTELNTAVGRLFLLSAHYALILLKASFSFFSICRKYRRSPAAAVTTQSDSGHYRHSSLTGEEHVVISSAQQSAPDWSLSP